LLDYDKYFSYYIHRSKLTFWICITKWHLNYSYITLFFVANIDSLCPLAITHVLKAANSWRIVCGSTSWVDLDLSMYVGFTPLTGVDMIIISVYTHNLSVELSIELSHVPVRINWSSDVTMVMDVLWCSWLICRTCIWWLG